MENIKQTFTFSATMDDKMKAIIRKHVSEYEFIRIGETITVDKISHSYMPVEHEYKLHNVIKLIRAHPKDKIIIFTHTKRNTKTIQQILVSE
jgi:superfamily II DNA/RNA helicase